MRLKHERTLIQPVDGFAVATRVSWSPDKNRLAIASLQGTIHLFDEEGSWREHFKTKTNAEKGKYQYVTGRRKEMNSLSRRLRNCFAVSCGHFFPPGLSFSPSSKKLAVAQSDKTVSIYNIGKNWGDRKVICNKFTTSDQVSCLLWSQSTDEEVVWGGCDGFISLAELRRNEASSLFESGRYQSARHFHVPSDSEAFEFRALAPFNFFLPFSACQLRNVHGSWSGRKCTNHGAF